MQTTIIDNIGQEISLLGLLWIREMEYKKKYGTNHSSVIFGWEQVNKWESIDLVWVIQRILLHELCTWLCASGTYLHYVQAPASFESKWLSSGENC
jgi:hypothetical protein